MNAHGIVVIINGFAGSGKDEMVSYLENHLDLQEKVVIRSMSSIDPVRDMLRREGFPVDIKTPEMRKILADVGTALSAWRIEKCVQFAEKISALNFARKFPYIVFIHMREPKYIDELKLAYSRSAYPFDVRTLIVNRPDIERVTSNAADMEVENYTYDYKIDNDGTIRDLYSKATAFAEQLFSEIPARETVAQA